MTIRSMLFGLGLALTAGSALALPPLPPLPPPPPSPSAVAHRIQSDVNHVVGRDDDGRMDRDEDHDRGHHYARGHRHHHRHCVRHGRHGRCRHWPH